MHFAYGRVGIATVILTAAVPAQAQMLDVKDPAGLVAALVASGQTAELKQGAATGGPVIRAVNNQFEYSIHFTGCTAAQNCTGLYMHSSFTPAKKMSSAQIDAWNATSTFGKADLHATSGDPNLRQKLALTDGKLSAPLLIANTNQFREAMVSLIKVAFAS
ncbi:MAG: hypothetical protein EON59_02895 [Alphaproteobacteria bacterium]|nr:MAG: hypothetical protein EON59_02895 [Alphaproteobacteria bacterium]